MFCFCFLGADCPQLSAPLHGNIEGYRREIGSTVRVSCDQGYEVYRDSSSFRTCQANKQWSGADPVCKRKNEMFHTQYRIGAARMLFPFNLLLLSQNIFKILQSITCSYTFWYTLVIDCGDPGTPWHGYLHGANFHYNSNVTFSCRPQHHLEGDRQRTCQADGQWSGQQPKCLGELLFLSVRLACNWECLFPGLNFSG